MSETLEQEPAKAAKPDAPIFAAGRARTDRRDKPMILDMGEGSRLQGFKLNGSR